MHQLIDRAVLNNLVRHVTEENIPDLLHHCKSCRHVVFERVILPGNMGHECWNKNAMPGMSVDSTRKISVLVLFAALNQPGFTFSHKGLG
jgi:hypothetical protein